MKWGSSPQHNTLPYRFLDEVNFSGLHTGGFWNFGELAKFKQLQMRKKEIEILSSKSAEEKAKDEQKNSTLEELWKTFVQTQLRKQ